MGENPRANRVRVLEFEKETADRLQTLGAVETEILSVGQMRSRWLVSVSNIDEVETETFRLKLDYLKAKADLAALDLQIDKTRLEGHYETQTLNFLIAATKPLDTGETKDARAKTLEALARENLDDLNHALRTACDARSKLTREMHVATLELSKLRSNNDNRHSAVVGELQEKISAYAERMKETVVTSKKKHLQITGEYLVLRHNARVAKEVLLRSQNDAAMQRKLLQEKLDRLVEEAALQRSKMEAGALAELKVMTDDVRNLVIKKEAEVNDTRRAIHQIESARKATTKSMRKSIANYNSKYESLSRQRTSDVEDMKKELTDLRAMIARVELELANDKSVILDGRGREQEQELEYTIFRQLQEVKRSLSPQRAQLLARAGPSGGGGRV
jgi:hypothetical protein